MQILKKWDTLYWVVFVVFIIWKASTEINPYANVANTFGSVLIFAFAIYILPAILIWAVLKLIQKLVKKSRQKIN